VPIGDAEGPLLSSLWLVSAAGHAVPKPNSDDLRLITDHSAGIHSLNSMIPQNDHPTYPLDNLHLLGEILISAQDNDNASNLVLFKSDVAEAYRLMPMHPFWQVKQAVQIQGVLHIDRCGVFGGRKSGDYSVSFHALVAWVAREIKDILDLSVYSSDDFYGANDATDYTFYPPYNQHLPSKQCRLLLLWDELGIPHKPKKQVSGSPLIIIGIEVDPNRLMFTLSSDARRSLIDDISKFCQKRVKRKGAKATGSSAFSLKCWQRLAGWLNWAFNIYPLLCPCLNHLYHKIGKKDRAEELIFVNSDVRSDLSWAAEHLEQSDGVHLLCSISWSPSEADTTLYCDASLTGMGFWYPELNIAFHASNPPNFVPASSPAKERILPYECLCVVSALQHAAESMPPHFRIVIFTDSDNTVAMFSSLRCLPWYNPLLRYAVDLLLSHDLQLCVLHVPGHLNIIADFISRTHLSDAIYASPGLEILPFEPPPLRLGPTL